MFGSVILDVAVGLIFVYLIVSLIASTVNELISSLTNARSRMLETAIAKLLQGMQNPRDTSQTMAQGLYCHAIIKNLARENCKPSYIPARNFALALFDLLVPSDRKPTDRNPAVADPATGTATVVNPTNENPKSFESIRQAVNALPPSDGKQAILVFLDNAEKDVTSARKEIETWFDDAMNRVSGWYKYRTQWKIFIIGLVVAVILNVDTFMIGDALYRDTELRTSVAAAASQSVQGTLYKPDSTMSLDSLGHKITELQGRLSGLKLPIGWPTPPAGISGVSQTFGYYVSNISAGMVIGWLFTAIAVSLGAPFWFDLLNKIMNVRIAGRRPDEATTGSSKTKKEKQGDG